MKRYEDISKVEIGDKVIVDNALGLIPNVERTKLLAKVIEVLEDDNIKLEVESSLFKKPVETVFKYYLLQ